MADQRRGICEFTAAEDKGKTSEIIIIEKLPPNTAWTGQMCTAPVLTDGVSNHTQSPSNTFTASAGERVGVRCTPAPPAPLALAPRASVQRTQRGASVAGGARECRAPFAHRPSRQCTRRVSIPQGQRGAHPKGEDWGGAFCGIIKPLNSLNSSRGLT
jgi:hypothetical protein